MIGSILLIILTAITFVYFWLKRCFQFWENRCVPHLKPESLIFGNNGDVFTGKLSLPEHFSRLYNDLAPHKFGGIYSFYNPILYIRDPEIIKNVLIKDFQHFCDRSFTRAQKQDPLSLHLFNLYGDEWRTMRHKLSPTFTSGKMKMLFALMHECAEGLEKIIEGKVLAHDAVRVKDLTARYATDVISSCAFGLEVDSLHNPNSEFRTMGKMVFTPTVRQRLREILFLISPKFVSFIGLRSFPQRLTDFFINLVRDTIQYRTKNGIVRNDFLNLLMNVQKESEKLKHSDFTVELLTAQCFVFFIAGFEASSNSLSLILYELAENQDVQRKLQGEVDRIHEKYDGKITYEALQEMHYMEKVFNETSRLFPALAMLSRICTEDYRLPNSRCVVKRGERILIPIYALHRDPQYFPNPDVFNPENFSEEAKASRPACCFLPFGDGPRNCIGAYISFKENLLGKVIENEPPPLDSMRFGIMQVKLALAMIMKQYTVTVSPQMKLPLELMRYTLLTKCKNDILLNFSKRNE